MKFHTTILQRRFLVWALLKFGNGKDPTSQDIRLSDAEAVKLAKRMAGFHSGSGFRAFPSSWPRWVCTALKYMPDSAWADDGERWSHHVVQSDVAWLDENGVPSLEQVSPSREHYLQVVHEWTDHLRVETEVIGQGATSLPKVGKCADWMRDVLDVLSDVISNAPDPDGPDTPPERPVPLTSTSDFPAFDAVGA